VIPSGVVQRPSRVAVLGALAFALAAIWIIGVSAGAITIPPSRVFAVLCESLGFGVPSDVDAHDRAVLLGIRMPRTLLAMLVGAALGISGAAMQALCRNPLVEPGLAGTSVGAALGAGSWIVAAPPALRATGPAGVAAAAFAGAWFATFIVWMLSRRAGAVAPAALLLAGIAINALGGAGLGLLLFVANDVQLRDLAFWSLGSLNGATWNAVLVVALCILPAVCWLPRRAPALNALALGEEEAAHLGFDVRRLRRVVVALTALAVGGAVALCGAIGFVGLLVPHMIRFAAGPDQRVLLPGSALLGAVLLVGADVASRTVAPPAEIPVRVLTALAGAPLFLWLLRRDPGHGSAST
jgi:iron complex transport system permease protein